MLTGAETKRTRPDAQKYCETCPVCSQPGVDQSIDSAKSLLLLLLCDLFRLQEGIFPVLSTNSTPASPVGNGSQFSQVAV